MNASKWLDSRDSAYLVDLLELNFLSIYEQLTPEQRGVAFGRLTRLEEETNGFLGYHGIIAILSYDNRTATVSEANEIIRILRSRGEKDKPLYQRVLDCKFARSKSWGLTLVKCEVTLNDLVNHRNNKPKKTKQRNFRGRRQRK